MIEISYTKSLLVYFYRSKSYIVLFNSICSTVDIHTDICNITDHIHEGDRKNLINLIIFAYREKQV